MAINNLGINSRIIFSIPLISLIVEIVRSFIPGETDIIGYRNLFFFILIFTFVLVYFKEIAKNQKFIIIFFSLLFILVFISSNTTKSLTQYVILFNSIMLFPLGKILTNNKRDLVYSIKNTFYMGLLFSISIIIFSLFGLGINQYGGSEDFTTGYFALSHFYTGSFVLLLYPLAYYYLKSFAKKRIIWLNSIIIIILLLLNMRRTAMVIPFIGTAVYIYFNRINFNFLIATAFMLATLFLLSPFYEDILSEQIEARYSVISVSNISMEKYITESRFLESIIVAEERILNPKSILQALFGNELFNSVGHYNNGLWGDRPIHVDLNVILHGSGVVGFILYLLFLYRIVRFNKDENKSIKNKILVGSYYSLVAALIFVSFSGGLFAFTFRSFLFLNLGILQKVLTDDNHY